MHIEKMSKEVSDMKQALAEEVTETQSRQIQLDKTAEDFRRLHQERQELVQQWDEAMEAMRKRDEMIQARAPLPRPGARCPSLCFLGHGDVNSVHLHSLHLPPPSPRLCSSVLLFSAALYRNSLVSPFLPPF